MVAEHVSDNSFRRARPLHHSFIKIVSRFFSKTPCAISYFRYLNVIIVFLCLLLYAYCVLTLYNAPTPTINCMSSFVNKICRLI